MRNWCVRKDFFNESVLSRIYGVCKWIVFFFRGFCNGYWFFVCADFIKCNVFMYIINPCMFDPTQHNLTIRSKQKKLSKRNKI